MTLENFFMPVATRIADLPYTSETKMKIAEIGGLATGFVGGVVVFGGAYVAGKKIVSLIKSK